MRSHQVSRRFSKTAVLDITNPQANSRQNNRWTNRQLINGISPCLLVVCWQISRTAKIFIFPCINLSDPVHQEEKKISLLCNFPTATPYHQFRSRFSCYSLNGVCAVITRTWQEYTCVKSAHLLLHHVCNVIVSLTWQWLMLLRTVGRKQMVRNFEWFMADLPKNGQSVRQTALHVELFFLPRFNFHYIAFVHLKLFLYIVDAVEMTSKLIEDLHIM